MVSVAPGTSPDTDAPLRVVVADDRYLVRRARGLIGASRLVGVNTTLWYVGAPGWIRARRLAWVLWSGEDGPYGCADREEAWWRRTSLRRWARLITL